MKTPIKIAYNWIGPRGPIVNTELPNVLSFAAVAEGTNTTSRNFWTDDLWWRVFHRHPEKAFQLSPVWDLTDSEIFIYPYTLIWRVDFNNYFFPNNGLFEFSHTSGSVIHQVRMGKGYFLIDCTAEAWITTRHLEAMHLYFSNYNNIPMGKIIYMTGCMNANDLYRQWCDERGISNSNNDRMIMVSFPVSQSGIAVHISSGYDEATYDTETVPEKLFLSWNRRFKTHRSMLALSLDNLGLLDRSYFSMQKVDPENVLVPFENTIDVNYIQGYMNFTQEEVNNLTNKLPLNLDNETEIGQMCGDFDNAARPFYQNSLVSIVTETNYEPRELTLTEKSYKPAKEKHPFIIIGVPGALKSMREQGYKTFSDFWDESYDTIQNPRERFYRIIEVCKYIGSWDREQIINFRRNVKSIVEHNYANLKIDSAFIAADKIKRKVRGEE